MPTWEPKPGVPASFDLAEQAAALVTGDPAWGWLVAWLPSLGVADNVTADFCAQGPPDFTFDPTVLLPVAGRTPAQTAINILARIQSVRHLAEQRVFAAYCQARSETGVWAVDTTRCGPYHDPYNGGGIWGRQYLPIPAGATQMRVTYQGVTETGDNQWAGRAAVYSGVDEASPTHLPGADTWHPVGTGDYSYGPWTFPVGSNRYQAFIIGNNGVQPNGCVVTEFNATGTDDFHPDVPVPPPGYVGPAAKTYNTIADLGRELDAQEFKLDLLGSHLRFLTSMLAVPSTDELSTPIDVEADTPVDVVDAAGCIVTLSAIPSWADEDFGTPRRVFRIGRIDFGNAVAWATSVEITHSPFLVQPLPLGTTRIQVNTHPSVSAQLLLLKRPK